MDKATCERLAPRIRRCACFLAHAYSADPDDMAQEITLGILEAERKRPDLLDHTDSYIVTAGEFAARHQLRKEHRHQNRTCGEEGAPPSAHAPHPFGCTPGAHTDADTTLDLEAAVSELHPLTQAFVQALWLGYTKQDAARMVGRSPAWAIETIRRVIQPALRGLA